VHHRVAVDPKPGDTNDVHDFLRQHFLHWLEMMSLIGRTKESLAQLESLREWLQVWFKHGLLNSVSNW
jgi:hypothetical protein